MKTFIVRLVSIIIFSIVLINLFIDSFFTLVMLGFSFIPLVFIFLAKLIKGRKKTKEEELRKMIEKEESPKDLTKKGKNLLSRLLDLIVIIVILLVLGILCLVTIETVGEIFSPTPSKVSEVQEKVEWIDEENMIIGKVYEKKYGDGTTEAKILISADDWSDPITFLAAQEFIFNCDGCESGKRMEIMKNNRIITDGKTKWFTFDKNKPSSFKFKAIGSPTIVWVTYDEK